MKRSLLILLMVVFFASTANATVTLSYTNKDERSHRFQITICGKTKMVTFSGLKSSSIKIRGNCDKLLIRTSCGYVSVYSGDSILIKDGCISKN